MTVRERVPVYMQKMRRRLTKTDYAAFATFLFFAVCVLFAIHTQLCLEDETYHTALNRRLAEGDRLFVDEWGVTQMSHLFGVPPYLLFTGLFGTTDGIVIFMRYLYLAAMLILFWFYYIKLRDCGPGSVFAALLLVGTPIYGMMILNYYNIALQGAAIASVMLFLPTKRQPAPRLFLIGVIFSCAVLCEPGFALAYVCYTLSVAIRYVRSKRRKDPFSAYAFVLETRIWRWVTAGVAVCFLVFSVYLLVHSGWRNIIDNLPGFFSNKYNLNPQTFLWRFISRFTAMHSSYTVTLPILLTVLAVLTVVLRRKNRLDERRKRLIVISAVALCAAAYAVAAIRSMISSDALFYLNQGMFLPLYIGTFILFSVTENADPRLFAFWILATVISLASDPPSLGMICFGGRFSCIPFVFLLRSCMTELGTNGSEKDAPACPADGTPGKKRISARSAFSAAACALALSCIVMVGYQYADGYVNQLRIYPGNNERFEMIGSGPMTGIAAKTSYCRFYEAADRDLEIIRQNCKGPFFAVSVFPYAYIYLDLPIGIYSPFAPFETPISEAERYLQYWELHPERRPEYLYLLTDFEDPIYYEYFSGADESFLSFLRNQCEFELTKGNCGDIIRVTRWF